MKTYHTPADVAGILNVSVATLRNWRDTGQGPAFIQLSDRTVRYPRTEFTNWLNQRSSHKTIGSRAVAESDTQITAICEFCDEPAFEKENGMDLCPAHALEARKEGYRARGYRV